MFGLPDFASGDRSSVVGHEHAASSATRTNKTAGARQAGREQTIQFLS
ncbi:hypothetical protein ACFHW2_06875 [Actinomadura sp. LOL_016]